MDHPLTDLLCEERPAAEAADFSETIPEEPTAPYSPLPEEPQTVQDVLPEAPALQERDITPEQEIPANIPREAPMAYPSGNETFRGNAPVQAGMGYAYGQPGAFNPYQNGNNGQPVNRNSPNPYSPDYYKANGYGAPYASQLPPRIPVRKNRKPVTSLILGSVAMVVLYFIPFVAMVLGIIALCIGFSGLRQGELSKGKRACGIIGLVLGSISLLLSVAMLFTLLVLSIRAIDALEIFGDSIFR